MQTFLPTPLPFDFFLLLSLFALGAFSGLAAGLLGIGGGMILVPFLTNILLQVGVPETVIMHSAVASALAIILFTSLSSMRAHHKASAIQWHIVRWMSVGLLFGAFAGAKLVTLIPTKPLSMVFAGFVLFSAYQMWANRKPKPSRILPSHFGLVGVGSIVGAVSSWVGAGGGFLSVPFMIYCNVPVRHAVATSAAMGFPIAIFSSLGYVVHGSHLNNMPWGSSGYIYWPAVLCVAVISVLTAPLGARLAHTLPVERIKRIFAALLVIVALLMLFEPSTS